MLIGGIAQKTDLWWHGFFRFETAATKGSTINSVKLNMWSNSVVDGTMTLMSGGFLKPQAIVGDFNWQHRDGVGRWRDGADVPFGQVVFLDHPEVWWDDALAFSRVPMDSQPSDAGDWSLGDGVSAFNNVPGMASQLQSYLADDGNEMLRGTGNTPGALPICFQLYHEFIVAPLPGSQGIKSSDASFVPLLHPTLEIDWRPATGHIISRGRLSPTVRSSAILEPTIQSSGALASTVRSRGALTPTIQSRGTLTPTVRSRGKLL